MTKPTDDAAAKQPRERKIRGHDYRAWDKFDVVGDSLLVCNFADLNEYDLCKAHNRVDQHISATCASLCGRLYFAFFQSCTFLRHFLYL